MTTPPPRFKTLDELTPAEHAERQRTGELPESPAYRDYVRKVHERAGLEPPTTNPAEKPLEEWTPHDHATTRSPRP